MTNPANEKTIYWQSMLEKWKYGGLSSRLSVHGKGSMSNA